MFFSGGFSPLTINSVMVQSHYPWSNDPNVLFAMVTQRRYINGSNVGFQTLTQDSTSQQTTSFGSGLGFTVADNWGSNNLRSIETNGTTQSLQSGLAYINQFAAGTNTSYTLLVAVKVLTPTGSFRAIGGWTDTTKAANNIAGFRNNGGSPPKYVVVRAADTGSVVTATSTETIDTNAHALCVVFDGSAQTTTLYIDGVLSSINAASLSVGALSATHLVYTIAASDSTSIANFTQLRIRTWLLWKGVMPAAQRDSYTRFMLAEAA